MTIIFRYVIREIALTSIAICGVLLLILMSGRFVKYLSSALSGDLDPAIIFAIIGYRIPEFLELAFPLAFLMGIMLTFGRMYSENEMSILQASGVSLGRLLKFVLLLGLLFAMFNATLSLYLSPIGASKANLLLKAQDELSELDKITPKKFYKLSGERGVTYAERVSEDGVLENVFLSVFNDSALQGTEGFVILLASTGIQQVTEDNGDSYLVLKNGYRFQGMPGQYNHQVTSFNEYGSKLSEKRKVIRGKEVDTMSSFDLFRSESAEASAALQWRLSLPIMLIVLVIIAVSLSKTDPRKGRYAKILPAILIYFLYFSALNYVARQIRFEQISSDFALLFVHLFFLSFAITIMFREKIKFFALKIGDELG